MRREQACARRWQRSLICLVMLALPMPIFASDVRIGVLAWLGADEAEAQWSPFMEAMLRGLPGHHFSMRHLDLDGMAQALQRREVDFVVTNPGHYVALESNLGITRIATQVAATGQDPAHVVGSAVIVLAARDELRELDDLRHKTLAAVAPEAFGGYQVVWAELKRRGIDPEAGQVTPRFTGFPMSKVVEAVAAGQADAGVIRTCLLERLIKEGAVPADRFRVLSASAGKPCLASSPRYPGWAFAAARHTAPELSREVLLTLLALPPDDGGQAWSVPADYQPVHEMLRDLRIGPYAFLREHEIEALMRRYWPVAGAVALLLIFWLGYTLRVEVMVQKRTRELSAALATRERLEESIRTHRQQMEHLSRLSILGELSGTLAHELNQPLATIVNYSRSLTRRLHRGSLSEAAIGQAADEIAAESERAASILESIRSFARKRARVRADRDLGNLACETVRLFRGMLAHAPNVAIDDGLPSDARLVTVDPLQVQQVLLNLLKNALDAQRAAGVPDRRVDLRLHSDGERSYVTVRDGGAGLTSEVRARLFEPFFTTKPDGLGLGLSICKTIVEAHGGELTAESPADGPGTVFQFSLPRSLPAASETPHEPDCP